MNEYEQTIDGRTTKAWLHPCGSDKLMVFMHAHNSSNTRARSRALAESLNARDIDCLLVEAGRRFFADGSVEVTTISKEVEQFLNMKDLMDGYGQVFFSGHSQGANVAIIAAARSPPTGVIPIAPMMESHSDGKLSRIGMTRKALQEEPGFEEKEDATYRYTDEYFEDAEGYDFLATASDVKAPVLFIAGENDNSVPVKEVMKGFAAAGGPARMVVIPGMEHKFTSSDVEAIAKEIVGWIGEAR